MYACLYENFYVLQGAITIAVNEKYACNNMFWAFQEMCNIVL